MPRPGAAAAEGGLQQLDGLVHDVMRDTGASMGLVFLLPPGERMLQLAAVCGASQQLAAPWSRITTDTRVPVADAVRERRLVWVDSQEAMARSYPRLRLVLPYDFMLAAAPMTDTAVWGGIVLLWPVWHPPQLSPRERDAIDAFCRHAAALLQRAAEQGRPLLPGPEPRVLLPPRTRAPRQAEALAAVEFAERLPMGCCALDLDGRITFINSAAVDLVGAGAADLLGARPWEVLLWMRTAVFEDHYRSAVVSRQPTSFTALRPPERWLSFQLYPDARGISVHITPVRHGQEAETTPRKQPPPTETVGAVALYHLMHLAAALTEAVGMRDVADLAADQLVPAFGPQGLALMMTEDGRLRIIGYRGYTAEFMSRYDGAPLSSDTPPAHALTTGVPSFFPSFADFQDAYPEAVRYGDRNAWAFLPLITSGRPVGALVLSYDHPRPFPPAERTLLTSLAGLIAQALDRAHLYDTKHDLARSLQVGLLPQDLPRIHGLDVAARYLPAGHGMDVGGDFYDLIRCDETSAAAAIGDVQGHNVTAAALMGQVRTAVHAHAAIGTPPSDVLARTNRLLTELDTGLFTSCLLAHLDLARHRASLASAGHPPPLLRHPDGHTEVLHLPPGLLLGIDPAADYPSTEIPLPPGAVLALYTDGLVESPGMDLEDTIDDLADRLARAQDRSMDSLAGTLVDHARKSPSRSDDIALLLIHPQRGDG
ncbi:PAS/PAC sensor protein [Streptomyces hygroscopicus]|uniref:SpoIIE family protein phosphatase n=1 Tax=Streptomyces hygroscopicus TaxID=1912 RepID=UPI002240D5BB|nr:SpoIIE family protein phosphatase [Streptomyces hygroscopicus]MCW7940724.1 PAS/PAC sensor protein [Streptomyces hygroscopicus]